MSSLTNRVALVTGAASKDIGRGMHRVLDRVTYHAVYDASILDALQFARANGFAGVQVAVEAPHLSFERLSDEQVDAIADYRARHGLLISLHGPDDRCCLFEHSPVLGDGIFAYFEALAAFAQRVGAHLITVHLGSMASFAAATRPRQTMPDVDVDLYYEALDVNLTRLTELVGPRATLCVEAFDLSAQARQVLQRHLDRGGLRLCWDLAKSYDADRNRLAALEAFCWHNVDRIAHVHLHDRLSRRSHEVVGTGWINFMRPLPGLADANVAEYCIEVRPREKAVESLRNLRGLLTPRMADCACSK